LSNVVSSEPAQAYCQYTSLSEIQFRLAETASELKKEAAASKGMMPGESFYWSGKADIPGKPVLYGEGQLILAGAVLGLIAAVFLLQSGLLSLIERKLHHD
jgi:hypothetical protein